METIKCRNCGNKGHKLRNCKFPRLSYGIILFNIPLPPRGSFLLNPSAVF